MPLARRPDRLTAAALAALVLFACQSAPSAPPRPPATETTTDRAARVISALVPAVARQGEPPARATLEARMARFHVPGVSIAVADGGRIAWARGYGVTRAGSRDPVTPTTLFPAASISKAVTATATLRLVEQGRLALDEDVNVYLRSWKVPDSEHTTREKVTLRRLLSHTAGTGVHMFPCFRESEPLPTLVQELDGIPPAKTAPVRVEAVPGAAWRYSGGGVLIEQLVLTDVTGRAFPALLRELVLAPLHMVDSTFEQPLPSSLRGRLAAEHDLSGALVPDWVDVCPEMAASGLTSTPSDLLRWAIAIGDAHAGRAGALLSRELATQMLTASVGPTGLGPFVAGDGPGFHFFHEGADGGFHSQVVYFPQAGQGAAVMVNGEAGYPLVREILFAIAAEYGWSGFAPRVVTTVPTDPVAAERIVGRYQAPYEGFVIEAEVRRVGERLVLEIPLLGTSTEVAFTSATGLVMLEVGHDFELVTDAAGVVTAIRIGSVELARQAP